LKFAKSASDPARTECISGPPEFSSFRGHHICAD
jgi:hypothetical protein